ncbi:MAG TPA: pyrroline-5-carboxylate reductase [Candidatus Sulfotelmatobacter sp.]|nr:pyrroline-5-carboxylate reductase [Candidatus Sulfotelmatobacter sp.]
MASTNGPRRYGVVGAGVMGGALLRALLDHGVAPNLCWATAASEETCARVHDEYGVRCTTEVPATALALTGTLLLCVKPYQIDAAAQALTQAGLGGGTVVVSIVAGVTTDRLHQLLGPVPIVRAMTNTPAIIGEAMTVLARGAHADDAAITAAHAVFDHVGMTLELRESMLDAVTALSGSGPAYMYLIVEALADAGVRVGLQREVALTLATQTMLGAARMVQRSGRHPASLRDDVTTPAGCTIGALLVLEDGKLRSTLARAVEEATQIVGDLGRPGR